MALIIGSKLKINLVKLSEIIRNNQQKIMFIAVSDFI